MLVEPGAHSMTDGGGYMLTGCFGGVMQRAGHKVVVTRVVAVQASIDCRDSIQRPGAKVNSVSQA